MLISKSNHTFKSGFLLEFLIINIFSAPNYGVPFKQLNLNLNRLVKVKSKITIE